MSAFMIPMPVEPTLEEHREASAAWLKRIGPCLYENWPEPLRALSFDSRLVELSSDDQAALLDAFDNDRGERIEKLAERLDGEIRERFSGQAFAKLSSRSPKDWNDDLRCVSGADVIDKFTSSERILDDMVEYRYLDHPCYILLREWRDIPKHEEWRCFIRDGKIIGITQYFYTDDFQNIYKDNAFEIEGRISNFLLSAVIPILHVDPVVVDVWLKDEPMVIEINPFGGSDPCLLTYAELAEGPCGIRINTGGEAAI